MVTRHTISYADEVYFGDAYHAPYSSPKSRRGVEASLPYYLNLGAVTAADADGLVTSVDPASGATLTLRSTVTGMTNTGGVVTLDTARNVTITASGDESTKSALFTGTDIYGEALSEAITAPNATTVQGKKSFKTISSIVMTGDAGTITVGFGNIFGLPFRVAARQRVIPYVNGRLASPHYLTGTFTAIGTAQNIAVIDPIGGVITEMSGVSAAANGTASSTVTVTNGTPTVGTVVFTSSYSALDPLASSAIAADIKRDLAPQGVIKLATDGTGDGAGQATITIAVSPCLVTAGVDTTATTTTGDIRGTLNFGGIPDSTLTFGAWIMPNRTTKNEAFGITQA